MTKRRVHLVDEMIDEMDSCMDNLAVNLDGWMQKISRSFCQGREAVTSQIGSHLDFVKTAFAEVSECGSSDLC